MKLGNVSQSIVPVPKFFLNNKSIDLVPLYNKTEIYFSPQRSNINKKRKVGNYLVIKKRMKIMILKKQLIS